MESIYHNSDIEKRMANRIFLNELSECEKFPKYFEIEPIDICNASCIMCEAGRHMKGRKGTVMSMELFENIIEQLQPHAEWIEMITVTGRGESLLDKTLEEKVKRLKSIGIKRICLSTNAALLSEERVMDLFRNGLNDLRISIDSVRKDIYEKIRGLKFDDVIRNAERAIQIRNEMFPNIPIRIRAVELPENLGEREEWESFWRQRTSDIDLVHFIPYAANQNGDEEGSGMIITSPCISPFSTMVIRSMGQVDLCCVDFTYGKMEMGNLRDSSIIEIWRNKKFYAVRKAHLEGKREQVSFCQGCVAWG